MTLSPSRPSALFRSPRRITITLPLHTYEELQQRCDSEGRSLSNLAAFLLETALQPSQERNVVRNARPAVAIAQP